jgi:hypothetical protein
LYRRRSIPGVLAKSIPGVLAKVVSHPLSSAHKILRRSWRPQRRLLLTTSGACLRKHGFPKSDSEVGPVELS